MGYLKAMENNGCAVVSYTDSTGVGGTTHLYFANVKVPVETLALKDINVDLGHSLKDFDSIRKKKKRRRQI